MKMQTFAKVASPPCSFMVITTRAETQDCAERERERDVGNLLSPSRFDVFEARVFLLCKYIIPTGSVNLLRHHKRISFFVS